MRERDRSCAKLRFAKNLPQLLECDVHSNVLRMTDTRKCDSHKWIWQKGWDVCHNGNNNHNPVIIIASHNLFSVNRFTKLTFNAFSFIDFLIDSGTLKIKHKMGQWSHFCNWIVELKCPLREGCICLFKIHLWQIVNYFFFKHFSWKSLSSETHSHGLTWNWRMGLSWVVWEWYTASYICFMLKISCIKLLHGCINTEIHKINTDLCVGDGMSKN